MPLNAYASPITLAKEEDLFAYLGMESFKGDEIYKSTIVVDNTECMVLIGSSGVLVEVEDGMWHRTECGMFSNPVQAAWDVMNLLVLAWSQEDGSYLSSELKNSGWEFESNH